MTLDDVERFIHFREPIAVSQTTGGPQRDARILYRDVKLDGPTTLTFTLFYDNAGEFSPAESLNFDGCEANQQLRVELMDASAPADSTAPKHVLATIFKTAAGDPQKLAPKTVTFDLGAALPAAARALRAARTP